MAQSHDSRGVPEHSVAALCFVASCMWISMGAHTYHSAWDHWDHSGQTKNERTNRRKTQATNGWNPQKLVICIDPYGGNLYFTFDGSLHCTFTSTTTNNHWLMVATMIFLLGGPEFQVVSPFVDSGGEPKTSSPKVGFEGNFGGFFRP